MVGSEWDNDRDRKIACNLFKDEIDVFAFANFSTALA